MIALTLCFDITVAFHKSLSTMLVGISWWSPACLYLPHPLSKMSLAPGLQSIGWYGKCVLCQTKHGMVTIDYGIKSLLSCAKQATAMLCFRILRSSKKSEIHLLQTQAIAPISRITRLETMKSNQNQAPYQKTTLYQNPGYKHQTNDQRTRKHHARNHPT